MSFTGVAGRVSRLRCSCNMGNDVESRFGTDQVSFGALFETTMSGLRAIEDRHAPVPYSAPLPALHGALQT